MLRIGDTIFSLDVLEKKFRCDLPKCLGNCCRYGDSGAPIADAEISILDEIWPVVKKYLRPEGIKVIGKEGSVVIDFEGEKVTPLIGNEECAYTIIDKGVLMCGIEKAWHEGKITFRKPLSCHLFPVRIKQFSDFKAVNYQELAICSAGREKGQGEAIFLYEFLKEPLIRALGEKVYNELCIAAKEINNQKKWER